MQSRALDLIEPLKDKIPTWDVDRLSALAKKDSVLWDASDKLFLEEQAAKAKEILGEPKVPAEAPAAETPAAEAPLIEGVTGLESTKTTGQINEATKLLKEMEKEGKRYQSQSFKN